MIKSFAVLEAGGELKPYEYDPGDLWRDEVEIDVEHCGVCHSDLSMIDNAWGMTGYPLVPGHEVIGTVAKKGAGVTSVNVDHSARSAENIVASAVMFSLRGRAARPLVG